MMQVYLTKAPMMLRQVFPKRCFHVGQGVQFFRPPWFSLRDISLVIREFERMFESLDRFPASKFRFSKSWDVAHRDVPIETAADGSRMFHLDLDVSRFKVEDIKVKIHDQLITVEASKKSKNSDGSKMTSELKYQYTLPEEVDPEKVHSLISEDGVLTLEAPLPELKPPEQKEIPIEKSSTKTGK